MTDWPKYESHKIVQAAKIVGFRDDNGSAAVVDPGTGVLEDFKPNSYDMLERAKIGDWAMLYPDGYKSISPAKAFEEGYTKVAG